MSQTATDFLTRCFAPGETIALLLRRESTVRPAQRIVRLEQAIAPAYLRWLAHENHAGANSYVVANPLRSGSRRRTKETIAEIRHLYIDIDSDGEARVAVLRSSDAVPVPTTILSTSHGKYQVLWRVEGFDFARQEQTLKLLASAFGGDLACTDCNRVLRIPGFLNRKYDPAHRVTVEYPDDSVWSPDDFRLDWITPNGASIGIGLLPRKQPHKLTNSEVDWAWVCDQLTHGKDAVKLTRELASQRSDKPNPVYYAQRTVDVASARFWLIEGIRMEDVIAMLECRRRYEIPDPLCAARAREIAATAQRMIASRKTA